MENLDSALRKINELREKEINKQILFLLIAVLLPFTYFNGLMDKFYFEPAFKIALPINKIFGIWMSIIYTLLVYAIPILLFLYSLRQIFTIPRTFKDSVGLYFINEILKEKGAVLEIGGYEISSDVWEKFIDDYDDYDIDHIVKSEYITMQYMEFTKEYTSKDEDGNTTTDEENLFSGYIVVFKLSKNYNIHIKIKSNIFHLGDVLPIFYDASRIKLDNPEFEKKFDVYGDNQIDARVYLNHNRMKSLLSINIDRDIIIDNDKAYYAFSSEPMYSKAIPFYSKVDKEDIYHLADIYNKIEDIYEKIK